jgi:hypothetical protein
VHGARTDLWGGRVGNHRLYPAADGPHDRLFSQARGSVVCGPPLTAGAWLPSDEPYTEGNLSRANGLSYDAHERILD